MKAIKTLMAAAMTPRHWLLLAVALTTMIFTKSLMTLL